MDFCLQGFDAVGWAAGGHPACKKTDWWGAGMVICLEQGADLHMTSCHSKTQLLIRHGICLVGVLASLTVQLAATLVHAFVTSRVSIVLRLSS